MSSDHVPASSRKHKFSRTPIPALVRAIREPVTSLGGGQSQPDNTSNSAKKVPGTPDVSQSTVRQAAALERLRHRVGQPASDTAATLQMSENTDAQQSREASVRKEGSSKEASVRKEGSPSKRPRLDDPAPPAPAHAPRADPTLPPLSKASYPPPLEVLFSFMAPSHFASALSGHLAPHLLSLVIDPMHSYHRPIRHDTPVQAFLDGVPDCATFTHAWSQLGCIMTHGLAENSPGEEMLRLGICMGEYLGFICDCSAKYSWESIVRFHIRVMTPIFRRGGLEINAWRDWDRGRNLVLLEPLPPNSGR